jgi:hypothetical protein
MTRRLETLEDELAAIALWDKDYQQSENPPFVDTLAWKARRQRADEIRRELMTLEAVPVPGKGNNGANGSPQKTERLPDTKSSGSKARRFTQDRSSEPSVLPSTYHRQLVMAVEQAAESVVLTDIDGHIT